MFRILGVLCFVFFISGVAGASTSVTDSVSLKVRNFDKEALDEYRSDSDFIYGETGLDTSPGYWQRFWRWFWSLFSERLSEARGGSRSFFKYLAILVGAAVVIFAVVKLVGMDIRLILTGKPREIPLPYSETVEHIDQISFEEEIEDALGRKDYRLAVRLQYLKTLKMLSDAGRIKWALDKTNAEYVNEVRDLELKEQFKHLTRQFEYVWYGSFPIDAAGFSKISENFSNFKLYRR
jgi:hypothetical protein